MHHFCKLFFLYIQVLLGGGGIPCIFICTYPIPSESTYRLKYEEYFEIYIDKDIHRYSKCTGGVKGSFIKLVPQLNSPYADYNFHVKSVKAVKTGGILKEIVGYEVTIEISKHILPLSHGFAQKKVDLCQLFSFSLTICIAIYKYQRRFPFTQSRSDENIELRVAFDGKTFFVINSFSLSRISYISENVIKIGPKLINEMGFNFVNIQVNGISEY
ncbi:hypothetical protein ABG067_005372 [Albugo candida]